MLASIEDLANAGSGTRAVRTQQEPLPLNPAGHRLTGRAPIQFVIAGVSFAGLRGGCARGTVASTCVAATFAQGPGRPRNNFTGAGLVGTTSASGTTPYLTPHLQEAVASIDGLVSKLIGLKRKARPLRTSQIVASVCGWALRRRCACEVPRRCGLCSSLARAIRPFGAIYI